MTPQSGIWFFLSVKVQGAAFLIWFEERAQAVHLITKNSHDQAAHDFVSYSVQDTSIKVGA